MVVSPPPQKNGDKNFEMKNWSHDIGISLLQNIDDVDMKTHWSHQSYEQGNPTQNPLNSGLGP